MRLIAGFIRENVGRGDVLAAPPNAMLSAAFLAAWLYAVNDQAPACFELIAEPLYALPPYGSWK